MFIELASVIEHRLVQKRAHEARERVLQHLGVE
jgi:hypothetical protein